MKSTIEILEERISAAMAKVAGRQGRAAIVRPTTDAKFGDYQANGVMALAKQMKTNPRKLAEDVVKALDLGDICEEPEIAGPGFINLRLKADFLAAGLLEINKDTDHLGVQRTSDPKTIVVDFSSPNIAKQMHVGHLRSTIIGDCICRMLEALGHNVIRQNHIGDWGTQFGKVILSLWHVCMAMEVHKKAYYKEELDLLNHNKDDKNKLYDICLKIRDRHNNDYTNDQEEDFGDAKLVFGPFLQRLPEIAEEIWPEILASYQYVNLMDDILVGMKLRIYSREIVNNVVKKIDIPYENLSRRITVMLQRGDPIEDKQERDAWNAVKEITMQHCNQIYKRLNVTLEHPRDTRGESYYNPVLLDVVETLKKCGLAKESERAICTFPKDFKNKKGKPLPFIIQKSDGAFLYATTDLAAARYRMQGIDYRDNVYKANRIIYVTDNRQDLHFKMLFETIHDAKNAGWINETVDLTHITFGSMLGEDGTPLKTRSGDNVKLEELLEGAEQRALSVVEEKNPDLRGEEKEKIAKAVGIGAVKYADYSNNRTSDYIFSFDKMLAMDGNTAPYMQYAYARIKSIERKAESKDVDIEAELAGVKALNLTEPAELDLAKHLIRYGESIQAAAADYRPNYLTVYLYELAQKFSAFYTNCPVLVAGPDKRPTRLLLCDLTARTIRHGLRELLGIDVVEQM